MDRAEHLAWCKERAREYADQGDGASCIASLRSDLGKHEDTARSCQVVDALMLPLALAGHLDNPRELRKFVEGFN